MFPRDWFFFDALRQVSNALGNHESALKAGLELHRLAPFDSPSYRGEVYTYLLLNRVEEAAAAAEEAHMKGLDSNLAAILYGIAFYRDNSTEMARQVARAKGVPGH